MPHSLSFLLSTEAAKARMVERKPAFVVHVETTSNFEFPDRFVELDANEVTQAENMANTWVRHMGNTSAAVRRVLHDGTLLDPIKII